MVKRPMYESARAQYPRVLVWALARGASNNFDACAPFFPSRRDTIDVLCTWPSYERRAASPTRLALGYYTYKHTCTFTIPLFPCTLVVRVLRSCSLHPGGASTMLTRLDIKNSRVGARPCRITNERPSATISCHVPPRPCCCSLWCVRCLHRDFFFCFVLRFPLLL